MDEIAYLRKQIKKNQRALLMKEDSIRRTRDLRERCEMAYEAAIFAVQNVTDVFSSETIEAPFLELAQKHSVKLSSQYSPGSVLHVMTTAYNRGGHTRCVERWIDQMPGMVHSCVVLAPFAPIPALLTQLVEKSGGVIECYDAKETMLTRALALRQLASSYEYVVLHIHMDDPIPLIAFGTPEFTRPVVLFNHADHAFWLGVSIADCVANLNSSGCELCAKRSVARASVLGIPQDNSSSATCESQEARRKLGLPSDKKIIFVSGHSAKFKPLGPRSFFDVVSDLVRADNNIVFYIVGPEASADFWPKLKQMFPENLFLTGYLDYDGEYPLYLSAADLVIDSYPVGGGASLIDAVKAGKPILTLTQELLADFVLTSKALCRSYEEFLAMVQRVLNDASFARGVYNDVYERFIQETDVAVWQKKCKGILSRLTSPHQIHTFHRQAPDAEVSSLALNVYRWSSQAYVLPWYKKLRRALYYARFKKRERFIRLFGVYLMRRRSYVYDER